MLIVVSTIIIVTFATIMGNNAIVNANKKIDSELELSIELVNQILPENYHDDIDNIESVSQEEYLEYVKKFDEICIEYNLEYLWSLIEDDEGIIRFTSGTSPDKINNEGYAEFYSVHSNQQDYVPIFDSMENKHLVITDEWGSVRSLIVPVQTEDGQKYCLGAAKKADSVADIRRASILPVLISAVVLLFFAIIFAIFFTKKMLHPLNRTIAAMGSIVDGKHGKTLALSGLYEQRQLINNFNKMSLAIKEKIDDIDQLNQHLDITFESIGDGVITTDNSGIITRLNSEGQLVTGWHRDDAIGRQFEDVFQIIDKNTREKSASPIKRVLQEKQTIMLKRDTVLICKDGTEKVISDSAAPIKDNYGNVKGSVLVFRDNTMEYKRIEQIEHISKHDNLTGVYNRHFFEMEKLRLDNEKFYPLSIVVGDVNGLKLVNDVFGHEKGDEVLINVAKTLTENFRQKDVIARWGGDEFVILLPNTTSDECEIICNRIIAYNRKSTEYAAKQSISLGHFTKMELDQDIDYVLKEAEEMMYRHKLQESDSVRNNIITSLESILGEKYYETELHAQNLNDICIKLGEKANMKKQEIDALTLIARLHDIGKIGINESIILKPGKLTNEEWEVVKQHSEIGYRISSAIPAIAHIAKGILHHHEKYDGTGYPHGLKGNQIPKISRIITIVDSYDVMLSRRPYKEPMSKNEAIAELIRCSGTQFDPELVEMFIQVMGD